MHAADDVLDSLAASPAAEPRRWTLPVFSDEARYDTEWTRPPPEETPAGTERLRLDMAFAFCGRVRIEAERSAAGAIAIRVTTERALPAALADQLRARAEALAAVWGGGLTMTWQQGAPA